MNVHFEMLVDVKWGDTDPSGLIYFPRMMFWFNDAEHELFRRAGFPVDSMIEKERAGFVMGNIEFRFESPAAYGDKVIASLNLEEVGNSTMRWHCKAVQKIGGAVVTRGIATRVYVEFLEDGSLTSRPIPDTILEALQDYTKAV